MLDWLGRTWKRTKVWEWHGKSFQRRKNLTLCYGGWQQYNNTWGGCWRAATDPGLRGSKNIWQCVQLYWIPVWLAMVMWGIWTFNCLKSARFERPRVVFPFVCLPPPLTDTSWRHPPVPTIWQPKVKQILPHFWIYSSLNFLINPFLPSVQKVGLSMTIFLV